MLLRILYFPPQEVAFAHQGHRDKGSIVRPPPYDHLIGVSLHALLRHLR